MNNFSFSFLRSKCQAIEAIQNLKIRLLIRIFPIYFVPFAEIVLNSLLPLRGFNGYIWQRRQKNGFEFAED
jgi:hypothetical protein